MISAAADLMYVRGVNAVALDDVRAATGTSKSQLYKHFPDGKPELVRAVVAQYAEQILAREEQRLKRLKSMSGLRRWCDALVQGAAMQGGAHGCALGNLVVELSDQDEQAHTSLLVRRDSSADSRASGSQLRSSVFPRTRSVTVEPKPAGRAANSTATTPPPTRSTRGGTYVMVAKSRFVHGRACGNPSISSGTLGRVPVAITTACRAIKTSSESSVYATRTVRWPLNRPNP